VVICGRLKPFFFSVRGATYAKTIIHHREPARFHDSHLSRPLPLHLPKPSRSSSEAAEGEDSCSSIEIPTGSGRLNDAIEGPTAEHQQIDLSLCAISRPSKIHQALMAPSNSNAPKDTTHAYLRMVLFICPP